MGPKPYFLIFTETGRTLFWLDSKIIRRYYAYSKKNNLENSTQTVYYIRDPKLIERVPHISARKLCVKYESRFP